MTCRILMINNEYPPLGGGTASVNALLLKELAGDGRFQIDLITSSSSASFEKEHESENITIHRLPSRQANPHHAANLDLILFFLRSLRYALRLVRKGKYSFCFAWCTVPAGALAWLLWLRYKLPYFVRISGPELPGFEARYDRIVKLLLPLFRRIWKSSRAVIVKTCYEADLVSVESPAARLVTIPNSVDPSVFFPEAEKGRGEVIRFTTVGRLIPRKRVDLMLRALSLLKEEGLDFSFAIAGEGDKREELELLSDSLGLGGAVFFLGELPRRQIAEHLRAHDVFILASENEGMSVSILEALYCGLKVVCPDIPGLMELKEDRRFALQLLFFPIDSGPHELADALQEATQSGELHAVSVTPCAGDFKRGYIDLFSEA